MSLISKSWVVICVCLFALLAIQTFDFSPYLVISSRQIENRYMYISFYACFKLELKKANCSISSDASRPKREFTCDFRAPISCYTKGLQEKSPAEIIGLFKRCNLRRLVEPELDPTQGKDRNVRKVATLVESSELRLFFDQICLVLVYQFGKEKANMKGGSDTTIFYFGAEHKIPYSVKAVIDYDSQSSSDFIPVFKR